LPLCFAAQNSALNAIIPASLSATGSLPLVKKMLGHQNMQTTRAKLSFWMLICTTA
jgi:hypothetical protein